MTEMREIIMLILFFGAFIATFIAMLVKIMDHVDSQLGDK